MKCLRKATCKRYGMCKATSAMECAQRQALWNVQSDKRCGMYKATSAKCHVHAHFFQPSFAIFFQRAMSIGPEKKMMLCVVCCFVFLVSCFLFRVSCLVLLFAGLFQKGSSKRVVPKKVSG